MRVIEAAGARAPYPTPDSPDLNPIEGAVPEQRGLLRSAGERTAEGLWSLLGRSLDACAPEGCRNYLRHCGYAATAR